MNNDKSLSEAIHDMIADANSTPEKVFYYTEDEVMNLCKDAVNNYIKSSVSGYSFIEWFEHVKKK